MPFLLRKVHKAWWLPDGHEEWLSPGHAQGDSLGDLETDDNILSFWVIDDTRSNLVQNQGTFSGAISWGSCAQPEPANPSLAARHRQRSEHHF